MAFGFECRPGLCLGIVADLINFHLQQSSFAFFLPLVGSKVQDPNQSCLEYVLVEILLSNVLKFEYFSYQIYSQFN